MCVRRVVVGALAVVRFFAWTAPALALDPNKALTQYVHNAWQTDQGLPQNSVQAVLQTRDGYLWFGTQEGLVRFDGEHFEIFDRSNTHTLAHNDVTALLEDRLGRLWVGTYGGGLAWYKDGAFTSFSAQEALSDEFVTALREDSRGTVWIGTRDHGIFGFADRHVRSVTAKDGLASNRVNAIYEDRGGDLWVGTSEGLNRLRGRNIVRFSIADGLVNPHITAIAGDAIGALWIGTDAGLNRFVWNMRYADAPKLEGDPPMDEATERGIAGPIAPPGAYRVRLRVGGETREARFEIRVDPRVSATDRELQDQFALALAVRDKLAETHEAINAIRRMRAQIEAWLERIKGRRELRAFERSGRSLSAKLRDVEGELVQWRARTRSETLALPIRLNSKLAWLSAVVGSADAAPTQGMRELFADLSKRVDAQLKRLATLEQAELKEFNAAVRREKLPPVSR